MEVNMLVSEYSKVKWNAKIKNHYVELGYVFIKMKDEFIVKTTDLTNGSDISVDIKCDYCGKIYSKHWHRYLSERNGVIEKDCCNECKKLKIQETALIKYGVNTVFKLKDIKNKISKTNLEKYGVENPFASDVIKDKICETNIEKYGFKTPLQNDVIKNKIKKTCLEKYGETCFLKTLNQTGENSPVWKGGVKHHRVERATGTYVNWRNSVYEKDNYTCQCCGKKNGFGETIKFNAHHINNWADYPELRYDVDNGITMCKECHNKFHSIYGKKKNNQFQLEEFFNQDKKIC